ncbi:MAG: hypothetical protein GY762_13390, partial [Proteobacteria bacterium]|nr:hypothetical protein [Pseudomonadota bacterium]
MRERTPTNNTAMIVVAWMVIAASLSGCIGVAQAEDATADVHVRIGAHNVLFGNWAKPQRIGEMFKAHDLDVIGFNEVPNGDWTAKVGQQLGMKHVYVGKIASANHKDKYKSILSRTPLTNMHEIEINAEGWKPASMVGADTIISGVSLRVYSLHIPGRPYFTDKAAGSAAQFIATEVIPKIDVDRFIIIGDFNSHVGDAPFNKLEQAGMRASWKDIGFDVLPESTHQHIETGTESGVIDHIFYNVASGAKACGGGIIKDAFNPSNEDKPMPNYRAEWEKYGKPLSDHRPIWAELVYPDTAKSQVSVDPAVIDNRDKKTVAQTDHPLDWFHEAKSGIMIHYLANPLEASGAGKGIVLKDGQWDRQIDAFDVDGLADQLQDIGADYLVISVGQNTGYYCSPNATYDKIVGITPSKCSRRDLVVDLSKALKARGIRLIVYLPSNAPA